MSYFFARRDPDRWDYFLRAAAGAGWQVMVDSGAYSAHTQGEQVDLGAYARFVARRESMIWDHVVLDVVGRRADTRANLRAMRKRGLRPMAVLTDDMDPADAPALIEASGNERLCVAGATHWETNAILARIALVRRAAPMARVHGLGLTRDTAAWRSGAMTVDSSTWAVGTRYGKFSTFSIANGCRQHDWRELRAAKSMAQWPEEVRDVAVRSGIRPKDTRAAWFNSGALSALNLITCEAWLRFAAFALARGVGFFFATTSLQQLLPLAAAARHRLPGGGLDLHAAVEFGKRLMRAYREDRNRATDGLMALDWAC